MNFLLPKIFKFVIKPEVIKSRQLFLTYFPRNTFKIIDMSSILDENNSTPLALKRKRYRIPASSKRHKENPEAKSSVMILNEMKPGTQYNLVESESVPNTKNFVIEVIWDGQSYRGIGKNKKMAKQMASLAVLKSLPQLMDPHKVVHLLPRPVCQDFTSDDIPVMETQTYTTPDVKFEVTPELPKLNDCYNDNVNPTISKNAIMKVNELFPGLNYELIESQGDYHYKVVIDGITFNGGGRNKKQAKHDVAQKILDSGILERKSRTGNIDFTEDSIPEVGKKIKQIKQEIPTNNSMNLLKELHKTYRDLKFTYTTTINGNQHHHTISTEVQGKIFEGTGKNKKLAKYDVAEKILKANLSDNAQPIKIEEVSEPPKEAPPIEEVPKVPPSLNNIPRNNLSELNKFMPGLEYTYDEDKDVKNAQIFTASTLVNGVVYKGFGRSKKIAKQGAAGCVLRAVYNIDCIEPDKVTIPSTAEYITPMPLDLPDRVCNSIWDKFSTLTDHFTSNNAKFKVLAGMVMTNTITNATEVVSLSTGSKCINGENIIHKGTALLDCHAEIISKRGLRRFLYQQLMSYKEQDSIFETLQNGGFRLKSNFQFHLYINTAPCGDSRIFSKDTNLSCDDNHPNRLNRGLLRVKIENGEGTIPVDNNLILENNNNQSLDAIISGERLLTMSCSDKIAKWNTLGVQGSLLSLYIEPIYISSIIIGTLYHHKHVERAVYGRFKHALDQSSDFETMIGAKFRIQRPMLAAASSCDSRVAKKAPKFCFHWSKGDIAPTVVDMKTGKTQTGESSNLCKYEMLRMFEKHHDSKTHKPLCEYNYVKGTTSYKRLKEQASDYQDMKQRLIEGLMKVGYGKWVGKPTEVDLFATK